MVASTPRQPIVSDRHLPLQLLPLSPESSPRFRLVIREGPEGAATLVNFSGGQTPSHFRIIKIVNHAAPGSAVSRWDEGSSAIIDGFIRGAVDNGMGGKNMKSARFAAAN